VKLNNVVIEEYDYDSNGNRSDYSSTRAGLAGTSTYNDDDQLEANSNASYGYDANGRLATRTRNVVDGDPVITSYDYSSDGRLLSVTTPEHTITYRHNAFGNRVAKLVDGVITEKYLWENKTRLLATFDGDNNLKHSYEYTVGNTPTSYYAGNQRYYILTDQLGSPRIITDSAGNVLREIEYDSYGNIIADSNPTHELPFGFAGGLYDQHTGLIRFGFRDYDPETGRWTARDPIGFAGGDTNLYGYVLGDPVNGIDPEGLEVRVYSSDAWGVEGINHSYVYSTETGSGRGANGSSGYELGDGVGGFDNPYTVVDLPKNMSESKFMNLIDSADNWNNGLYFPFVNDCHNDLERAFDHAGVEYPGAPNGRFDFDDNSRIDRSKYRLTRRGWRR
jgi:RHS repeat-associated protein